MVRLWLVKRLGKWVKDLCLLEFSSHVVWKLIGVIPFHSGTSILSCTSILFYQSSILGCTFIVVCNPILEYTFIPDCTSNLLLNLQCRWSP